MVPGVLVFWGANAVIFCRNAGTLCGSPLAGVVSDLVAPWSLGRRVSDLVAPWSLGRRCC